MKRLLQIAALISVVLLAGQPAFAGLPCAEGAATKMGCAVGCTMSMSQAGAMQMGADCPMPAQAATSGCGQNCCQHGLLQGLTQPVATSQSKKQFKTGRTTHFAAAPQMILSASPTIAAPPPDLSIASPPARYILFQVFRI
jgi:hypothetical protein